MREIGPGGSSTCRRGKVFGKNTVICGRVCKQNGVQARFAANAASRPDDGLSIQQAIHTTEHSYNHTTTQPYNHTIIQQTTKRPKTQTDDRHTVNQQTANRQAINRFFVTFDAGYSVQLFVSQLIGQGLRSFWARSVFYGQALPIHYGLHRTVW